MDAITPCPCGSGSGLAACCGPIVRGERAAPTAERLMRSRYTAFVLEDEEHLLRTWHASSRPDEVRFVPGQVWTGLDILATVAGDLFDQEGEVEFRAHHERRGRRRSLHEVSRFVRDASGAWVYLGAVEAEVEG